MKRILAVVSFVTILAASGQLFAVGYNVYSALIYVYDQDGNPLAGIPVSLFVQTWYGIDQEYTCLQNGTTGGNGSAYLECWIPEQYSMGLEFMVANMTDQGYTIISSENTYTSTASAIYPVFDIGIDNDGNNVVDIWELPLAEKFVPTFRLHSTNDWIAPEPVEYINADVTSGLWFSLINLNGQKVDDYRVTDEALFDPPVSNWHPWINNPNASWETLTFDTYDYVGDHPRITIIISDSISAFLETRIQLAGLRFINPSVITTLSVTPFMHIFLLPVQTTFSNTGSSIHITMDIIIMKGIGNT